MRSRSAGFLKSRLTNRNCRLTILLVVHQARRPRQRGYRKRVRRYTTRVECGTISHISKTLIETPFLSRILRQRWDRSDKDAGREQWYQVGKRDGRHYRWGHQLFFFAPCLQVLLTSHNPNKRNETDSGGRDTKVLTRRLPCQRSRARR